MREEREREARDPQGWETDRHALKGVPAWRKFLPQQGSPTVPDSTGSCCQGLGLLGGLVGSPSPPWAQHEWEESRFDLQVQSVSSMWGSGSSICRCVSAQDKHGHSVAPGGGPQQHWCLDEPPDTACSPWLGFHQGMDLPSSAHPQLLFPHWIQQGGSPKGLLAFSSPVPHLVLRVGVPLRTRWHSCGS